MSAGPHEPAAATGPDAEGFERLDPKLVLVGALLGGMVALVATIPTVIAVARDDEPLIAVAGIALGGIVLVVGGGALLEYLRWRSTHFRVTDERFEWVFELVVTKRRSLPRERIRTVDLTANPVQRLLGLTSVMIGTGQQGGSDGTIKLDSVSRARADALRVRLLDRTASSSPAPAAGTTTPAPLAVLDWRWAGFAPLSFVTPALGAAAVGALFNFASWFNGGDQASLVGEIVRSTAIYSLLIIVLGALLAGAVGAVVLFVEMWWSYRLEREPGGTIRVQRGLLTTRSISIEERRLRGVDIVEPFGIRLVRAARVDAVATGLRQSPEDARGSHGTLLPAAPRAVADRVAAAVLGEDVAPSATVRLTPHPRAALHRRIRWFLAPVAVLVAALMVPAALLAPLLEGTDADVLAGPLRALPIVAGVVGVPLALMFAWDAYKNLGHALSERYLVVRRGAVRRSTVALRRSGVIGWTIRQSVFQRRVGVLTLIATTAAGAGAYLVPDVDRSEGLSYADEAVPGLLRQFLE